MSYFYKKIGAVHKRKGLQCWEFVVTYKYFDKPKTELFIRVPSKTKKTDYEHEFKKLLYAVNQFILQPESKAALATLKGASKYYSPVECSCAICNHSKQQGSNT
jgi:hypothetical protein